MRVSSNDDCAHASEDIETPYLRPSVVEMMSASIARAGFFFNSFFRFARATATVI